MPEGYPDRAPYDRAVGVRELGRLAETVHATVYFAPEPQENYRELGLRGYWRGYFASRAAALGAPDAATVTELFGGFAPSFVARAVPEVWTIAAPPAVLAARLDGAVAALRRVIGADASQAAALAIDAVDAADLSGYPLAAAHASVARPEGDVALLWYACTVLRELRGDAHLRAVGEFGLSWPVPHLLAAMTGRVDPQQRDFRGWTEDEWQAADDLIHANGWYRTDAGAALTERLEQRTDELTAAALGRPTEELERVLRPFALSASGLIPYPNAVGLRPLV